METSFGRVPILEPRPSFALDGEEASTPGVGPGSETIVSVKVKSTSGHCSTSPHGVSLPVGSEAQVAQGLTVTKRSLAIMFSH